MPLFGRRKAVPQQQPPGQRPVSQQAIEDAQNDFSNRFKTWLESIAQAQTETDADALSDEIVDRVGGVPRPRTAETLTRMQVTYLISYAGTYATRMVEHRRIEAVVAATEAEHSQRLRAAADYWETVQTYVARSLN
jgi:hypothetical protein